MVERIKSSQKVLQFMRMRPQITASKIGGGGRTGEEMLCGVRSPPLEREYIVRGKPDPGLI
jgi:hypothetical protein